MKKKNSSISRFLMPFSNLNWSNNRFVVVLFLLLITSFFVNLGVTPLLYEEPRRNIVPMEMLFDGNYFTPTIGGQFFYDHPPLWAWVVAGAMKIFGLNEVTARICCIFFFLLTGFYIYRLSKAYLTQRFALISSFAYLTAGGVFLTYTTLGEMDTFFSFLIFLCIGLVYKAHNNKNRFFDYASVYLVAFLAFLAKGPAAVVLIGLTMLGYYLYKKNWKYLFSKANIVGALFFLVLLFLYYFMISRTADPLLYMGGILKIVQSKTTSSFSIANYISHFMLLPVLPILDLYPMVFLVILLLDKRIRSLWKKHPLIEFFVITIGINIIIYLISSGTRGRYLYPFYPMSMMILVYLYENAPKSSIRLFQFLKKGYSYLMVFLSVFFLFFIGLTKYLLPDFSNSSFFLTVLLSVLLFYVAILLRGATTPVEVSGKSTYRNEMTGLLILTSILIKILFIHNVLLPHLGENLKNVQTPVTAESGQLANTRKQLGESIKRALGAVHTKENGKKIAALVGDGDLYFYKTPNADLHRLTAYLEMNLERTVRYIDTMQNGQSFYIVEKKNLSDFSDPTVLYTFSHENKENYLIQVN